MTVCHRLKKLSFTLIEILVVLMILTLVVSIMGVKIHEIYREQQFLSESQQVLNQLRMAQDLMVILDADVTVQLKKDRTNHTLISVLDVQKPLPDIWSRLVEKPLNLKIIESWEFNGQAVHPLSLQFILGSMSQGTLVLKKHQHSFFIELLGYPTPIERKKSKKERGYQRTSPQTFYPIDVRKKIYEDKNP